VGGPGGEPAAAAPTWADVSYRDADGAGSGGVAGQSAPAGVVGGSTRLQAAMSRLLAAALWAALALALVLGLVNCAGAVADRPPAAGATGPVPPPGGCAELVVAAWLAGDAGALTAVPGASRQAPVEDRRRAVATYTAAVAPGTAAWGFLVAAQVEQRDDHERWQPAGLQFFTVTMVESGGGCQGWSPAALPARVSAPRLTGEVASPYTVVLDHQGSELAATLQAFFAGMLTGVGSVERYVAPGVSVPVVEAPRYAEVRLVELRARAGSAIGRDARVPADGTRVALLATVVAEPDGDALPLVYPVTVGVRGGRWEVTATDPVVGREPGGPPHDPSRREEDT
jgi:hypothetical protein